MPHRFALLWLLLASLLAAPASAQSPDANRIPISVEANQPGAPVTMGLPMPKGALHSPDHVRLLTESGTEIPAQVTPVTTWAPADSSLKWIWVFFFTEATDRYVVEYGPDVRPSPRRLGGEQGEGERVTVRNNQRAGGFAEITTGPLRLRIQRTGPDTTGSGFLDAVWLDQEGDGFEDDDLVATGSAERGSFLDLTDPNGPDSSRAVIDQTFVEEGSGPLHTVVRVEGRYRYARPDNRDAPFVLRIHAYAGKPYVRVLHTITYTGDPDRHPDVDRQHALLATHPGPVANEDSLAGDSLWTVPNDQIRATGLSLDLALDAPAGGLRYRTALQDGDWWNPAAPRTAEGRTGAAPVSLRQYGPNPTRMPPLAASSPTERIGGFGAVLTRGSQTDSATTAPGWMEVQGQRRAVAVGTRHFFEEYPTALRLTPADSSVTAYHWPDAGPPMSFARHDAEEDGGMVDNFAPGLTKTTELVFSFHDASQSADRVRRTMDYVLDRPVAHAPPSWYADSRAFGPIAPRSDAFAEYERSMDYKFDWWHFNQNWEPWYGMFDYGDGRTYYFRDRWYLWTNNEPAVDYMWWRRFVRTGSREAYLTALAQSRHSMDVDNVHWPTGPSYRGDTNSPYDYFQTLSDTTAATPYLGMGRRHGWQQWTALLSAHVWTPGWLSAYYLAGCHRGLDVARLTGDYYQRRIFGEHGLTGRRLYLSIWNLAALYDATKDPDLRAELDDRVDRLLRLQERRGGQMIIDRYAYSQVYLANGLRRYVQLTGDDEARRGLVRHARWVRDNPPLDHEMESYLSSISVLLAGYQFSGEPTLLDAARHRARHLRTDALSQPVAAFATQEAVAESLKTVSHLPPDRQGRCGIWCITGGLRVFGWTHAYTVPELVYWLER